MKKNDNNNGLRQPTIENRYGIKPKDIQKATVLDPERLHMEPFWRNDAIGAWCLSGDTAKSDMDDLAGTYDEYWIGFYDEDAPAYKGKIRLDCSAYGGMCSYKFDRFYEGVDNEVDLRLHEMLLEKMNWMLDEGIISITGTG